MRVKLTPAFVAKPPLPKSPKDRAIYWDATMAGFGLMVTTSGHQSFVIQYRAARRSCRMSLKPGLTLQDARREAKKMLGDVARGNDPLAERRKAATAGEDTLQAIAEDYLKRESKRSIDQTKAVLERCVFPALATARSLTFAEPISSGCSTGSLTREAFRWPTSPSPTSAES